MKHLFLSLSDQLDAMVLPLHLLSFSFYRKIKGLVLSLLRSPHDDENDNPPLCRVKKINHVFNFANYIYLKSIVSH